MSETKITLPNQCRTEWSEDTVIDILQYFFNTVDIDDIIISTHRLSKIDSIKNRIEDKNYENTSNNGNILLTQTIGESECILYFYSDKYTKENVLKELEMYINNTFSNIEANDNQTNYQTLHIQPESGIQTFTLG